MSTYTGLPWQGGGPWRISPECTAITHNTLLAARGRATGPHGSTKKIGPNCICPRARMAQEKDVVTRRNRYQSRALPKSSLRPARVSVNVAAGTWIPDGVHVPNLSNGPCATPKGRHVFDLVISGVGNAHKHGVIQSKKLCDQCPIATWTACDRYVTQGEGEDPGIWRGVWAGKTPAERKAGTGNVK